jgi:hypothetical protein
MQPLINSKCSKEQRQKDFVFILRPISILRPLEETMQRGDVVSLISPKNSNECFIKRIIALPGDIVRTIHYKQVRWA